MTPSSMALSLINCNPIVANDPILNSSLTSLATQILHMEHLIQVYMVSSNFFQIGNSRSVQQIVAVKCAIINAFVNPIGHPKITESLIFEPDHVKNEQNEVLLRGRFEH